jgi:hypothetical protein
MSSRLTRDDVRAMCLELLRGKPGPALPGPALPDPSVRVRLLRDGLQAPSGDVRIQAAREALEDSVHVALLRNEQRGDGSWGRLHSRDTAARQSIPTTEWAVERAVAIGLDVSHPILDAAAAYLAGVVTGRVIPSDPPEKNDRWATGVCLFAASTVARIDPNHPAIDPVWALWHEIARRTFASGSYSADDEADAHSELTGASVRGTYLILSNRYALSLLAARVDRMDEGLAQAVARWVWSHPRGVGYLEAPLSAPPAALPAGILERFLLSHEIVAGFSRIGAPTGPLADWFGEHRRADGLWDLGPRASWTSALPLSESWRRSDARAIDWTTRILALASRWMGHYAPRKASGLCSEVGRAMLGRSDGPVRRPSGTMKRKEIQ